MLLNKIQLKILNNAPRNKSPGKDISSLTQGEALKLRILNGTALILISLILIPVYQIAKFFAFINLAASSFSGKAQFVVMNEVDGSRVEASRDNYLELYGFTILVGVAHKLNLIEEQTNEGDEYE